MKTVALTGSIAMGKSTVADMISEQGIPVFDADAVVHDLYGKGGKAATEIAELFPDAVQDGVVDRNALSRHVVGNRSAMEKLEQIVHPLVQDARSRFMKQAWQSSADVVVFDIPLLFETNQQDDFDFVLVVSAPKHVQRARALSRPGMTEEKFESLVARQVDDEVKRNSADFVLRTDTNLEQTKSALLSILRQIEAS